MGEMYRSAFTTSKLMPVDVSCVAGQPIILGKYTISAGEMVQLGYGNLNAQESAEGRIFVDIRDNGVSPGLKKEGLVRFTVYSPQGRPLRILGEFRSEQLRTDATNRTLQIPFPSNSFPAVSEDKYIALEFVPDTTFTCSKTNTVILFDVSQYVV